VTDSPTRVALLGAGNIAGPYAESLLMHPELSLIGVFDLDEEKRAQFASTHGCASYASLDELYADAPGIVVNLTSAMYHFQTTKELLKFDTPVFSEKPLSLDYAGARELVETARESGTRLACAPSVWLGKAQLFALESVASGSVGDVRMVTAEVNQGRIEAWHPAPRLFYTVGPVVDAAVYPLTMLIALFGRVSSVSAVSRTLLESRQTLSGDSFTPETPDTWFIVADFASGPVLRLSCNFYVDSPTEDNNLIFHGNKGSLRLDDWLMPGSSVRIASYGEPYEELLPADDSVPLDWALGLADLAASLADGRPQKTLADRAAHVTQVLEAIGLSAREGRTVEIEADDITPPDSATGPDYFQSRSN
jgi:predicted dehydrogenase